MLTEPEITVKRSKILVCVNEKEHSRTALKFACAKARKTGSIIEMIYIIDPIDFNLVFSIGDAIKEDKREYAEKLLKSLSEDAEKWWEGSPCLIIKEGNFTDTIIDHINENDEVGLLILGVATDGSSKKSGIFQHLTSVLGDKFLIPLMLVPGNLTNQQIWELN